MGILELAKVSKNGGEYSIQLETSQDDPATKQKYLQKLPVAIGFGQGGHA